MLSKEVSLSAAETLLRNAVVNIQIVEPLDDDWHEFCLLTCHLRMGLPRTRVSKRPSLEAMFLAEIDIVSSNSGILEGRIAQQQKIDRRIKRWICGFL